MCDKEPSTIAQRDQLQARQDQIADDVLLLNNDQVYWKIQFNSSTN